MCVQNFDDSLSSAIRITYRISLRSSSLREPRHPLLKVVCCISYEMLQWCATRAASVSNVSEKWFKKWFKFVVLNPEVSLGARTAQVQFTGVSILDRCGNDPSAGSPTETLLRLHLPLNDEV